MVTAGALRQRVSILARTEASDGHDGLVETWDTVVRTRMSARVKPLQGRDLERAQQIDPRITHEVTFRFWSDYPADLDGGRARLLYHPTNDSSDDRTFEIVGAPMDIGESHLELRLACKEAA